MTMPNDKSTTGSNLKQIVDREIKRLERILIVGLHPVYNNDFESFLYDWGPDFSWNEYMMVEMQALLDNPQWTSLANNVKAKHGHDFIWAATETIKCGAE